MSSLPLAQPNQRLTQLQAWAGRLALDARAFQILFLGTLLISGVLWRDFTIQAEQIAATFIVALLTQTFWLRWFNLPIATTLAGYLSPLVTSFGLSILLRADSVWVHPLAAMLAISAKFLIRVQGKHIYNPANLGVIIGLTLLPGAWISPGQWGNELTLAIWVFVLGVTVTTRAFRLDTAWWFLGFFLGGAALRLWWLEVPLPRLSTLIQYQALSGALLLFSFFMISDPMTTPNHRVARVVYAAIVAAGALYWQFGLYKPNALVWALFIASPLVPILDKCWRSASFRWRRG